MRSVVLESNIKDVCGICGAKEPLIEYKELQEKVLSIEAAIDKIGYNSRGNNRYKFFCSFQLCKLGKHNYSGQCCKYRKWQLKRLQQFDKYNNRQGEYKISQCGELHNRNRKQNAYIRLRKQRNTQ